LPTAAFKPDQIEETKYENWRNELEHQNPTNQIEETKYENWRNELEHQNPTNQIETKYENWRNELEHQNPTHRQEYLNLLEVLIKLPCIQGSSQGLAAELHC
jgi:G3E family GTPase